MARSVCHSPRPGGLRMQKTQALVLASREPISHPALAVLDRPEAILGMNAGHLNGPLQMAPGRLSGLAPGLVELVRKALHGFGAELLRVKVDFQAVFVGHKVHVLAAATQSSLHKLEQIAGWV